MKILRFLCRVKLLVEMQSPERRAGSEIPMQNRSQSSASGEPEIGNGMRDRIQLYQTLKGVGEWGRKIRQGQLQSMDTPVSKEDELY